MCEIYPNLAGQASTEMMVELPFVGDLEASGMTNRESTYIYPWATYPVPQKIRV